MGAPLGHYPPFAGDARNSIGKRTINKTTFSDLGLRDELLTALGELGYEEPTPIQQEAIPPLIEGRDLLGNAATGTGKTAAFALPLLHTMTAIGSGRTPRALVLVPTRELAMQVSEAIHRYGRALGARVLPVYGGQPIFRQIKAMERGVDVVVATPGRARDHVARGTLVLDDITVVVLDEADEMLDMGFAEDIGAILDGIPEGRQTVLFSATMPPRIRAIAQSHLTDPVRVQIEDGPTAAGESPRIRQAAYVVQRAYKPAALVRLLDAESPTAALVFCRTRIEVEQLVETLNGRGYRAEALHGGMTQEQRDRVMGRLRSGTTDLLVATDVAARGLDIDQLTHVINFDVPSAPAQYVHRIGRVGRAGREGVAITLAEPREHRMLKNIERVTGQRVPQQALPTVADLRARRLDITTATLRESILEEELESFRVVVETLSDEFDVMDVAAAAVKLAHQASRGSDEDDEDIPEPRVREERPQRAGQGGGYKGGDGAPRRANRAGPSRPAPEGSTRIFVGAGRIAGVRPQDLVGAIANEANIAGREIGAIEIADRFSLVDVPASSAEKVIAALRAGSVKGRKVTVRRDGKPTK
ncbi:MAG: DEAD/DEAH box helicase [Thermoleophilia bacterium]|nr:DEAD/DEAH box helicase [Thermoleophilia bacterium]